tara:strand:- start:1078 stop:2109 length:1032 start_codon:yes stop_codon:yes gene_type:complete
METDTKETEAKSKKTKKKASPMVKRSTVLIFVGGLVIGLLASLLISSAGVTGAAVSEGAIEIKLATLFPGVEVTGAEDLGSGYAVDIVSPQGSGTVFVTKDGKFLSPAEMIDLDELAKQLEALEEEPEVISPEELKEPVGVDATERPTVELFVMSYCPYGLQMEKAFLPVKELLEEHADFSIKFVHYLMHGEKEAVENARQYCIQKDVPTEFDAYMNCFIRDGEGNEQACMALSGIDVAQVDSCIIDTYTEFKIEDDLASGDQFPRFGIDKEASEGYGVQGSPTLVINGEIVSAGRTPEAVKQAVCNAFTEAPEACQTTLSEDGFTPGFGLQASAATSAATCG